MQLEGSVLEEQIKNDYCATFLGKLIFAFKS
jgi:hypothetical protein